MDKISLAVSKLFPYEIKNYVFIYTPPKVGSTSLVSSLRISLSQFNIIHIHDEVMLNVLTGIDNVTINEIINYLACKEKNVYVIDIYRTPIERKMSEFFEKLAPYHFNNTEENINNYSLERVIKRFNNLFLFLANGDHYIDKYNIPLIPFNFDKKHTIQIVNNITYIKLRLCDVFIWDKILTEIFKIPIVIIKDYDTEKKTIGKLYKKFKSEYKIPINYLEQIKECKYLNYYYSPSEVKTYIDQWLKKTTDNTIGYSEAEYNLYVSIYLENQYIADIQKEHYLDTGCVCNECSKKRNILYQNLKSGKTVNIEKIEHVDKPQQIKCMFLPIKRNKIMQNERKRNSWYIKYC